MTQTFRQSGEPRDALSARAPWRYGTDTQGMRGGTPPPPPYRTGSPARRQPRPRRPAPGQAAPRPARGRGDRGGGVGGGTATPPGADGAAAPAAPTPAASSPTQSRAPSPAWPRRSAPAIVEISATSAAGEATGSGVVITADGEIVTNNHVISGAPRSRCRLSTGKTYTAEVVGTDPDKDLALIKLQGASGLKTATLGDSSSVKVGDQVVAIGSPEGLTGTVTSGIVSALDRDVTVAKDDDRASSSSNRAAATGRSSSAASSSTATPAPRRPRTRPSRPTPRSTPATPAAPSST